MAGIEAHTGARQPRRESRGRIRGFDCL